MLNSCSCPTISCRTALLASFKVHHIVRGPGGRARCHSMTVATRSVPPPCCALLIPAECSMSGWRNSTSPAISKDQIEANSTVEISRLRAPLTCRAAEFDRRHSLYRIPHRWTVLLVWVEAVRLLAIKSVVEPVRRPGEISTTAGRFSFAREHGRWRGKCDARRPDTSPARPWRHIGQVDKPKQLRGLRVIVWAQPKERSLV